VRGVRIPGGVRLVDIAATAIVIAAVELNIATSDGAAQKPLNALAYTAGVVLCLPVLFRRRWPLRVLLCCTALLIIDYIVDRRNISPAPLLTLPLYDAAAAGFLAWAIVIPVFFMIVGYIVTATSLHEGLTTLAANFLLPFAVIFLAVALGEVVRSRRALAAETADRLRIAEEEREAESARRVAEERLRIARDLHDTIAHSMATITVQAGSALHVLDGATSPADNGDTRAAPAGLRDSLAVIRETSKTALTDIRATLGWLRRDEAGTGGESAPAGLDGLPALAEAVTAAGAPVTVTIEGDRFPLPTAVDHAAYRILQESLTNVLRHAGQEASAAVCLAFAPGMLTIKVSDDGGDPPARGAGNQHSSPEEGEAGSSTPHTGTVDTGTADTGTADTGTGTADTGTAFTGTADTGTPHTGTAFAGTALTGSGHGITGMTERAVALGGELTAGPRPEGGFEVVARIPTGQPGADVSPGAKEVRA
jgi:signal transduction histidine kinase